MRLQRPEVVVRVQTTRYAESTQTPNSPTTIKHLEQVDLRPKTERSYERKHIAQQVWTLLKSETSNTGCGGVLAETCIPGAFLMDR